MPKLDTEQLKKRLDFSERKRATLKNMLAYRGGEEDTFLWALADLMTLMLIFFILLYSHTVSQKDSASSESSKHKYLLQRKVDSFRQHQKKETSSPKFQKAQSPELAFHQKLTEEDESLEQLRQKMLNAAGKGEDSSFSVRRDHNRLVLVFGERITFKKGEAELLEGFEPNLGRIAELIASREDYGVVVSGHTDDTPISSTRFPSNWELSATRAVNVAKFLIDHGVDPHRVVIQGYSEYRPVYKNISSENKQANRRVEITLEKQHSVASSL